MFPLRALLVSALLSVILSGWAIERITMADVIEQRNIAADRLDNDREFATYLMRFGYGC
jgi:hypothetical protein